MRSLLPSHALTSVINAAQSATFYFWPLDRLRIGCSACGANSNNSNNPSAWLKSWSNGTSYNSLTLSTNSRAVRCAGSHG